MGESSAALGLLGITKDNVAETLPALGRVAEKLDAWQNATLEDADVAQHISALGIKYQEVALAKRLTRKLTEAKRSHLKTEAFVNFQAHQQRRTDPVVCAHGAATRAVIEAELARCTWEVEQLSAGGKDQASLTSSLINGSVLKLRLFDIDGAYEDLQTAASLGSSDGRLDLLTRYSAQLKAPRHPEFLAGE
ncbi:unnamed protein product, partial [Polarella glacialis]